MYLQQYQVRFLASGPDGTPTTDDLNQAWERGWRLHTFSLARPSPIAVFERRPECGDEVYSEPFARDETEQEMEEVT